MCSLLNIVLDLLFVVVFKTGVAGAAAATVLSEAIAAVLCIIYAFRKVPQFGQAFEERISLGVIAAMKISAVVSVVLLIVFWAFGHPIMSIFVTNEESISIAAAGIRITSLFLIALGGVQILRYMLNGAGDSMYALINGVVEVIARVAFAVGLTAIPFIGMWGIWLTTGLTWTVTAVFALFRYKHGAWKEKKLV